MSDRVTETPEQAVPTVTSVVDLEERTWLARHCRGDQGAFPALLEAFRRPVYSYLVRHGVAEADRDDVFQNIFLKIHAAAPSYDPARPLAPWLFTIAANTVRNHLREGQLRGRYMEDERAGGRPIPFMSPQDQTPDVPDPEPGPERIATARETIVWLEKALLTLVPAQREALLLTTVAGLRQDDVAQVLGQPLNTIKTNLRRARLALTVALAERDAPSDVSGENQ
ncbi:MAG: sigma-70 family RNA polymerase sigma factor [Alphaproteobacteria bacterium]|nr:sigma-70 family RNA polymerase sigma factor [Alphaproteobacteria bacterium]